MNIPPHIRGCRKLSVNVAVSLLFLSLLITVVDLESIVESCRGADPVMIAYGAALSLAILALLGWQWYLLVRNNDVDYWLALRMVVAGLSIGLLTPGKVVGDASRLAFVKSGTRLNTLGMMVMEKGLETLILACLSIYGVFIVAGLSIAAVLTVICAAAAVLIFVFDLPRRLARLNSGDRPTDRLLGRLQGVRFSDRGTLGAACVVIALGSLTGFLQLHILLRAFGETELFPVLFVFPLIMLVNALPVPTIAGIGPRETAAVYLLGLYGIPGEVAFAAAFVWFLMTRIMAAIITGFYLLWNAIKGGLVEHSALSVDN